MIEVREVPTIPVGATLLGSADSRRPDAERWGEFAIYRLPDGRYAAKSVGKSLVANETDRERVIIADDAARLVTGMQYGRKRLPAPMQDALRKAADADAAFRAALGDALDVDTVSSGEPLPGSMVVTLPRPTNTRALRFSGRLISLASSTATPDGRSVSIFAVDGGGYVIDSHPVADDDEERAIVAYCRDARETMDRLLVSGGLTIPAFDALDSAARNDATFREQIGDRYRRAFGRQLIRCVNPDDPARVFHRNVSCILLSRSVYRDGSALVVYRAWSTKGAGFVYYLVAQRTRELPPDVYDVWTGNVEEVVALLHTPKTMRTLVECVARDRDLAWAARGVVGRTPADARPLHESIARDPLAATLPRGMISEKPPMWTGERHDEQYRESVLTETG